MEQQKPLGFPELSFSVESESEIISHRGLFYEELRTLSGCIYHLGSPDVRRKVNGFFYGAQLLDWQVETKSDGCLKFLPEFAVEVRHLFIKLPEASPIQTLVFSSDYQFGPEVRRYQRPLKNETFWRKHDAGKLWLNARYFIRP